MCGFREERSYRTPPPTPARRRAMMKTVHESPRQAVADRVTVALVAKAAADLLSTVERTGLSKTDIVNRALSLYEYVDARLAAGDELLIRNKETGQIEVIKLL
jgi:hypothetical protein